MRRNRDWNGRWTSRQKEKGRRPPVLYIQVRGKLSDTLFWFLLLRNFYGALATVYSTWSCRLHHRWWKCVKLTEKNKVRVDFCFVLFCFIKPPLCVICWNFYWFFRTFLKPYVCVIKTLRISCVLSTCGRRHEIDLGFDFDVRFQCARPKETAGKST